MSNPISLFERLNKEKPQVQTDKKPSLKEATQPIIPNQHDQPNPTKLNLSVAPKRDYTKVANSIARQAVPERFFKGMSKNTYDALYLKTRGAINPVRKIRATKSDLIRWTGVSDVTLDKHIKHLKSVGLVKVDFIIGSHEGNWYEVFIPEEITQPNQSNLTNPTYVPKKVGGDLPNLVGGDWVGQPPVFIEEDVPLKTSLKTNTNDDDTFARFIKKFQVASEEITGKKLDKRDSENLEKLAELLILELKVAVSRANGISSVPAFLTEVLRRQFFNNREKPEKNKSSRLTIKKDTVGKSNSDTYEVKPLDQKGREEALANLREFANDDFLPEFKKWYVEEDWKWLMEKLKSV